MKRAFGTTVLLLSVVPLFAQVPYERWFQGIIYASNGRVYEDGSALVTGQFYPSNTFLVRTDDIGTPLGTRLPSRPGRFTQLQNSLFTPTGEALLFNSNWTSPALNGSAVLTKWNTALDTVWAYGYNDTAFHTSGPDAPIFLAGEDGYLMGLLTRDTLGSFLQGKSLAVVDTGGVVQGAVSYTTALSLIQVIRANDGGYLFVGSEGAHRLCFKTDAAFAVEWCTELTAAFALRNERIVQGTDDVIHYFVGIRDTVETINFSPRTYSRSMAWLDLDPTTGALLNTREVDFRWPTYPSHLMRTSDGHFLAGGSYTNNTRIGGVLRRWEAYVLKLDAAGNMIWADTLAMDGYRNRVVSMDEHHDRLLLYTERYDHINPFHQFFVLDTEASPICGLARTEFTPLGAVDISAAPYAAPIFTPTSVSRAPFTWTIGNTAMTSLHLCGGITTDIEESTSPAFALYPDPVVDQLHLSPAPAFAGVTGLGTLTVTDLNGRIVLRTPDAAMVDVGGLVPGVYVLTRTASGGSWHARFVKE